MPKKYLHILRHAKSDWGSAELGDHDRPLNHRGRKAAAAMAEYLRARSIRPDLILCSTALRARETLALLHFDATDTCLERGLYLAEAAALKKRLRAVPQAVSTVLLIGHNPGLHELALDLAGQDDDTASSRRLAEGFPTAALASFVVNDWPKLSAATARLETFMVPRELPRA